MSMGHELGDGSVSVCSCGLPWLRNQEALVARYLILLKTNPNPKSPGHAAAHVAGFEMLLPAMHQLMTKSVARI